MYKTKTIKSNTLIIALSCLLLSACATQSGWTPTVDTYNDPNAPRLQQDMAECQQLAEHASGGTAKEAAVGGGVGALLGAAGGAVVGAIVGSPGTGAAVGAAAGGLGGATSQGIGAENQYKHAYNNCLRQRGHKVVN